MCDDTEEVTRYIVSSAIEGFCYNLASNKIRPQDSAQEAFKSVSDYLFTEFAGNANLLDILSTATTVNDVAVKVEQIRAKYDNNARKRKIVGNWLHELSSRIVHYGGVLDALAQHHPEYVGLVWGSMKFVLMGIINHAELVEQFARALTCIGYALPEVKLTAKLYDTDQMKEAITALYTQITRFLLRAAAWYKKSGIQRALSSIIKPFKLGYEDIVKNVKDYSDIITRIASGQSRAEVREIHSDVHMIQENQVGVQQELTTIKSQLNQVIEIVSLNKSVVQRIDHRVGDIHPRIHDMQYFQIRTGLTPYHDPEELLHSNESMMHRRKLKERSSNITPGLLQTLKGWVSTSSSSILVLQPGPRADPIAKEIAVDVISQIKSAKRNVFWNLSPIGHEGPQPSISDILRSLIFQVLKSEPSVLLDAPQELNVAKFTSGHSESEWLELLTTVVSKMTDCFLVVESDDLYKLWAGNQGWAHDFLSLFHRLADKVQASGARVKVLVVNFERDAAGLASPTGHCPRTVATVKRPAPIPSQLRRGRANVGRFRRFTGRSDLLLKS